MDSFYRLFLRNEPLLLFTVIGLGYALGRLRLAGFQLGVAAVLFTGLAFGAWSSTRGLVFTMSGPLTEIGLILFVYAVGLSSGPEFPESFRRRGLRLNLSIGAALAGGALFVAALGRLMQLPAELITGIYCGSLTNTPALAAVVDLLERTAPEKAAVPVLGYSLSYPFGVLGVLLTFELYARINRQERAKRPEAEEEPVQHSINRDSPDPLRVVVPLDRIGDLSEFFGDFERNTRETNYGAAAAGIACGVLLGMLPIPLHSGGSLTLGFAGGPLIMGLILGYAGRSGKTIWSIPLETNLVLRHIGLLFFLAGVGITAGSRAAGALNAQGLSVLVLGAATTAFTAALALVLLDSGLKAAPMTALGAVSGMQTQPAVLARAQELTKSDGVYVAYAACYPVAMVLKILLAQLLLYAFA